MPYTVSNLTSGNVSLGPTVVVPGGSVDVDFLSKFVIDALGAGYVSVTPAVTTAEPTPAALTIAVGTPSTTTTTDVGAAFNQTTLNNQIATLATLLNKCATSLAALQTQVRAQEARLDRITGAA
jgi:hypothetical protein